MFTIELRVKTRRVDSLHSFLLSTIDFCLLATVLCSYQQDFKNI